MDKPPDDFDPGDERILRAGEIALGLAPKAELDSALRDDPALGLEIARWDAIFAPLADELPDAPPAPRVWASLQRVMFEGTSVGNGWLRSFPLWRMAAAASFAAALVLGAFLVRTQSELRSLAEPRPKALMTAALAPKEGSPLFVATYDASQRSVFVVPAAFTPEAGRVAEFWIAPADVDEPIPLGRLDPSQPTKFIVPIDVAQKVNGETGLVVTSEPAGSPVSPASPGPLLAHGRFAVF